MARKQVSFDRIIDIISEVGDGQFITICYLSAASIYKKRNSLDDEKFGGALDANPFEDEEVGATFDRYRNGEMKKFPYQGIVKFCTRQFHWQSEDNYRKKYGQFRQWQDDFLTSHGAQPLAHKKPSDEKIDFGSGGISVGSTDNTANKTYIHQNGATSRIIDKDYGETYYLVDNNGELVGGISKPVVTSMLTKRKEDGGIAALRKIDASDEVINRYNEELKAQKFSVMKMMMDCMLFVVTKFEGQEYFAINRRLASRVGSGSYVVDIDPESFIQKAVEIFENIYKEKVEDYPVQEGRYIPITMEGINYIIQEATRRIQARLNEDRRRYEERRYL